MNPYPAGTLAAAMHDLGDAIGALFVPLVERLERIVVRLDSWLRG